MIEISWFKSLSFRKDQGRQVGKSKSESGTE